MVKNYFEYDYGCEWGEGEHLVKNYPDSKGNEMMRLVCKMIAMSDIDYHHVTKIVLDGREVEYCGWMPGMHMMFTYVDNGEVAYENWFPQWDH